jgi:hypothetical protein
MTTVVALLLVGVGSVAYRMLPLLGAARVPEAVSTAAGWAGISAHRRHGQGVLGAGDSIREQCGGPRRWPRPGHGGRASAAGRGGVGAAGCLVWPLQRAPLGTGRLGLRSSVRRIGRPA